MNLDPNENYLIRNAIQTPDGTIIESHNRHDFVCHTDANGFRYCVDGGLDYCRYSFDANAPSPKYLSKYLFKISNEEAVKIAKWGTYGKTGKEPLKWIPIADMETDHINKVLNFSNPLVQLEYLMEWELNKRKLASLE